MELTTYVNLSRITGWPSPISHEEAADRPAPERATPVTGAGLDATRLWVWAAVAPLSGHGPAASDFC
ncbi:hypothetical protein [Streptomyces laurentii]|uniref:hypothetical protein n=1 Tax=Streptomyces laurentii TaxID=39478 RepID=UPI003410FF96